VLLGGPSDRSPADEIIAALEANFPTLEFENHCGTGTLRESAAILFQSSEFWGIDSSLLHIARIAGLPCVSYWGPTDPATLLRPSWGLPDTIVYRKIACSPCVHTSNEPPCHGDNRCIEGLFNPERSPLDWTPIELPRPLHVIERR
jgi:ADP-heptose:LPS heptosyltransferase